MPTKLYNKLVRDKIPEIIKADNATPKTRILDEAEYQRELLAKLKEEVAEFEADLSVKELADIQEVVLALMKRLGISADELETTRIQRAGERGSFEKRIYLISVESDA